MTLDLIAIKARALSKRWPTVAELGQLKADNQTLIAEVERLQVIADRVRESVTTARLALHLTGDLDPRELIHHITTAMEGE